MGTMPQTEVLRGLCADAYPGNIDRGGRLNIKGFCALACVECEAACEYGLAALLLLPARERERLRCGGECESCRQPCLMQRVEYLTRTKRARKMKADMRRLWIATAMRPYYERRRAEARTAARK